MKKVFDGFISKLNTTEKRNSVFEDRSIEITKLNTKKKDKG